jgi:hypothetical protein
MEHQDPHPVDGLLAVVVVEVDLPTRPAVLVVLVVVVLVVTGHPVLLPTLLEVLEQ